MEKARSLAAMLVAFALLSGLFPAATGQGASGRAAPDLAFHPGSYGMVPASPRVGDEVVSNFTVANIGDADLTENFTVSFYLNTTATGLKPGESNVSFGGIGAGESFNVSIAWSSLNLAEGVNYTVLAIVDIEGRVAESDESNNQIGQNVTFLPRLYPDLAAFREKVWFAPSPPTAGDNITVTVAVENRGDEDSRFVDVFFYKNDTDTPLGSFVTLKDVNISESKNASIVWDARSLPPGRYDLLVFVNPRWSQNFHPELNTTNNNLTVPVELGRKVADLAIAGLAFQPPAPAVGDLVTVTVGVANAGNASSPECLLQLFPGYELEPLANATVPPLSPGATASVDVLWNTTGMPSGFNRMRAVIDAGYTFTDTNRTNNSLLWNLTLAGAVDLSLENLTVSPGPVRPGDNVSFTVTVRNLGSLRCGSANLTLRINGTAADHIQLLTLAAGGTMNATLRWTTAGLAPGLYPYELSVAPGPSDDDARPGNNLLSGQLTLEPPQAMADLRVKDIVLPSLPPRVGDQLTVAVVVENAGDLDGGASTVMVTLENKAGMVLRFTDTEVAIPAVPAGHSVTVNVTGDTARFAPGNYTIEVTADYANDLAESNESNNRLARPLAILDKEARRAVLVVGYIFFAGNRVEGEKVDIIVSISNSGNDTALDVVVRFIIDGKAAATQNLDQISAGTARNATLTWTFPPGDHTVKVQVSSTGLQEVSGERKVSIGAAPSGQGLLLVAVAVAVVMVAAAVGLVLWFRRPPAPGPRVKLVPEEEG